MIGSLRVEDPPTSAPTPRAHTLAILLHLFKVRIVEPRRALLRQALAAGDLPEPADPDALTSMLIGSFYGRYHDHKP